MDSQYCTGLSNIVIHCNANSVEQSRCAEKIAILAKIAGYHATVVKECSSAQQRPESQWEEGFEKHLSLNNFVNIQSANYVCIMAMDWSDSNARMNLEKCILNQLISDCVHKLLKATPFMPNTVTGIGRAFLFLDMADRLLESRKNDWREILPKLNEELREIARDWQWKEEQKKAQPTTVQLIVKYVCCSRIRQTVTVPQTPTQEAQAVDPKMLAPGSIIKGVEKPCFADILLAFDLAQHNEQLDWTNLEFAKHWFQKMLKEVDIGFAGCSCGSVKCLKTLVKQRSTKLSALLPNASSNDIEQEGSVRYKVATNEIGMPVMSMDMESSSSTMQPRL